MKQISTHGIYFLSPVDGSSTWYWGMDYTSGDLYEAEELFQDGHLVQQNRLILVRYPDGAVFEPVHAHAGQYLGRPVYYNGQIILLLADFSKSKFDLIAFDESTCQTELLVSLPRTVAEDCYNLLLHTSPLMLTRSPNNNKFQVLWPEYREFQIEDRESFHCRVGNQLYFNAWHEDPDYREEVIVRDWDTGAILLRRPGTIQTMPNGQNWILI